MEGLQVSPLVDEFIGEPLDPKTILGEYTSICESRGAHRFTRQSALKG